MKKIFYIFLIIIIYINIICPTSMATEEETLEEQQE